ncbi:polyribonucleotide nucleotidyltransferase [Acidaminobacter sp. JC074]|uniref:polyribonucleotide nucleotidyltransferase n=1 Tax=Acidaminobacter sp. JC074 TaxID=2530199 RepID=UPI001F0E9E70|nr:polyribonucleotide nucleotidyltransferase [Acidaminobacter sp. JC074]
MKRNIKVYETTLGGRPFVVELGRVANLSSGSAIVRYGDTAVLASATASAKPREGIDFFPLSVDYEEKMYSVGKIPGGFVKREGRPSEKAILNARLIDRPMRPMFPDGFFNEVQLIVSVLSVEQDNAPESIAITAASLAIAVSDIPFEATIAGVVVGYVDGQYVINPTVEQMERSRLNLTVAGTEEAIVMVEAGADILSEEEILEGIMFGHEAIKELVKFIDMIKAESGKEKMEVPEIVVDEELKKACFDFAYDKMNEAIRVQGKKERNKAVDTIKSDLLAHLAEDYPEREREIAGFFKKIEKETVRKMIIQEGKRPDGRAHDEVRPIECETSLLARTHGSALFSRGVTQALTITSVGALSEAQRIDGLGIEETKRYMHHYNFPPFAVGETGFMRGPNRRAIGHGALAERALVPVLPSEEEFPYAIRLVSEIVTCNGSSSMASICGSSMSLMDAGVPTKAPVAGIAMGLMQLDDKIAILSDIQAVEDFMGDMDFKAAGTKDGMTAIQMDIKIDGLSRELLENALEQARKGRLFILNEMDKEISEAREEMSPYAPRVFSMQIHPDKIRDVIGPGGKVITKITTECDVKIEITDEGLVLITAVDGKGGEEAKKRIEAIVKDIEVGEVYTGKIVRIMKFGAFVELLPGKDGMCHISQLDTKRIEKIEDHFKVGDQITVKVTEIDKQGRVNLSRKVLLKDAEEKKTEEKKSEE